MTERKLCPILKAGIMVTGYEHTFSVGPGMGGSQHNQLTHESAQCMGEECEWFECGCPAHLVTKEIRDKLHSMK